MQEKIIKNTIRPKVYQGKKIVRKLLPMKLVTKIKSVIPQKQFNLAFKIVHIIYKKQAQSNFDTIRYFPLGWKYKKKCVGSSANYKIYSLLEKHKILETYVDKNGKRFSPTRHKCCQYRINPVYLEGRSELITYTERLRKKIEN